MTWADADKQVMVLYWEQGGDTFRISTRQPDWTPDEPDDLEFAAKMIDGGVPLTGWEEFARDFLIRFER
jgi:hypothetical protein